MLHRITPRHIMLAIHHDDELNQMLQGVIIKQGGKMPFIHPLLVPMKKARPGNKTYADTSSQEY